MELQHFSNFLMYPGYYEPGDILDVMKRVRHYFRFHRSNTKQKYFNVPCSFDTESTSFRTEYGEKVGLMYVWTFGIYGLTILGRTWEEFTRMMDILSSVLDLNEEKRLVVYVHNLQHDFQFFRSHFTFTKVFASDRRKPLYALTDTGIEFRCSLMLSGMSLEKTGENLLKYKVKKAVGDLDYSIPRHAKTFLYPKECGYCVGDVKVVMAFIAEEIERADGIGNVPLTKTGYVRKYCRNACFYSPGEPHKKSKKRMKYRDMMRAMILNPNLYTQLKRGFAGGFTHGNAAHVRHLIPDVHSMDFTSSYPAVCIAELFPMGNPEPVDCSTLTGKQLKYYLSHYCCLFDIELAGLRPKRGVYENYISESKCFYIRRCSIHSDDHYSPIVNNGRIVSADRVMLTVTEIDFSIIRKVYDWDYMRVNNMTVWKKNYLPSDLVDAILTLYENKTQLKGVEGKEVEYLVSKGMINSVYGNFVTDPVREVNEYSDDWEEPYLPELEEALAKYNKSAARYSYYPWGIWVTAYARRNLFTGVIELGEDYIYADTDSLKFTNLEAHKDYFRSYNDTIIRQLEAAMMYHGFSVDRIRPKTVRGVEKPLGVWDYEGKYDLFKTLGAKRYLVFKNGKFELTVAGLNKRKAVPYLIQQKPYQHLSVKQIFRSFDNELFVPAEYTGKLTHTYIDEPRAGVLVDYQGNSYEYEELTGVNLEPSEYGLSLSRQFISYLTSIMKGIIEYGKE